MQLNSEKLDVEAFRCREDSTPSIGYQQYLRITFVFPGLVGSLPAVNIPSVNINFTEKTIIYKWHYYPSGKV